MGVEQRLVDAVRDGAELDLTDGDLVPAGVIRDLVRRGDVDPHGVRLRGAHIAGRVDLANIVADVRVELVDCVVPDGLSVRDGELRGLVLDGSEFGRPVDATRFTAPILSMRGTAGAVRLAGAHLGELDCRGARLANPNGPALLADGLRVDRAVRLSEEFEATGAVQLVDAHVGLLDCEGARLDGRNGPALWADGLRVDRAVFLRRGFRASGGGHAVLRLNGLEVGGSLWVDTGEVTRASRGALVDVDKMLYTEIPRPDGWLDLLRDHTPAYAAQPYQRLAAVHRAAGHDREARDILMAQRKDQIRRGGLRPLDRAWTRFTGLVLGFGYQPWRALLLLLAVVAVSVTLAVVLGGSGLADPAGGPCGVVDRVAVGLDRSLPLVKTQSLCVPTGTGQILTVVGWVLQLFSWALATLFVAGFTGAVRRT